MANEATLMWELEPSVPFTCADGTGIEKGTLLKLAYPATVAACSADGDIFVGIAAEEKIANDGNTKIPVWLRGIFKLTDSGSGITLGDCVKIAGANTVATADDDQVEKSSEVVGKCLETVGASETFLCLVGGAM